MSYTGIYGIEKNTSKKIGETKNAFRGAMAVWHILEERYLPSYPKPSFLGEDDPDYYYSRIGASMCHFGDEPMPMDEIWKLTKEDGLTDNEIIVMKSTFDNVLVKRENIPMLLEAFRSFEGETSLKEQADIIEEALDSNSEIVAIGWNQTSVNEAVWDIYDSEEGEYIGYDIENMDKHWFLFDDVEEED